MEEVEAMKLADYNFPRFARKEAAKLTQIAMHKIDYLADIGVVVPSKETGKPMYTKDQIIDLMIVEKLKKQLQVKEIREVLATLKEHHYRKNLFEVPLLFVNSQIHFLESWEEFGALLLESSKVDRGKVKIKRLDPIGETCLNLS
jgi:DNA-binding transcriptional MerR regulator